MYVAFGSAVLSNTQVFSNSADVSGGGLYAGHESALVSIYGGAVEPDVGQHVYEMHTVVTLTATPDADSEFIGWSGALSGATSPVTLTMNGDQAVTATFDLLSTVPTYTLSVIISPTMGGSVDLTPPGRVYEVGTVVTLTAIPAQDYTFTAWT